MYQIGQRGIAHGVATNALDSNIVVSEFELEFTFGWISFEKTWTPLSLIYILIQEKIIKLALAEDIHLFLFI